MSDDFSPNQSQLEVMTCRGQLCVIAGAGSGKTGTLVQTLALRLEESFRAGGDQRLDITDLLALTFTEKAAAELRERLAKTFGDRRRAAETRAEADFWRGQAARLDRADLGTIHGYALKLIRENAPALGLASAPAIDVDARGLDNDLAQIITDWLDQGDHDLLTLLRQFKLPDVTDMLKTCAVKLSGWGLPALTADLTVPPLDWVRGFRELKDLADEALTRLGEGVIPPDKDYYPRVLAAMEALRDHLSPPAEILAADPDFYLDRAMDLIAVRGGDWKTTKGRAMRTKLLDCAGTLTAARDGRLAIPFKAALLALTGRLPQALAQRKRRRGVINFDDILILARRLLATRPEIRRREIKRRRLVLIDEFQDTNRLQADLLAYLLLSPDDETIFPENHDLWRTMDWAAAQPRFSAFGDLKQSIYRFRGAEVEVMAGLGRAFQNGGGRLLALDHNYRSQGPLIDFFNTLFQKHLGPAYSPLDNQRPVRPALYPGPHIVQLRSTGDAPRRVGDRAAEQSRVLVKYLYDLFNDRGPVRIRVADGSPEGRRPEPGDVAVLFSRRARAAIFKEAILEAGWNCRVAAGVSPFDFAEVRALLAAMRYLSGQDREAGLAAVLRSPLGPVSDEGLLELVWPGPDQGPLKLADYFEEDQPWPASLTTADQTVLTELRLLLRALAPLVGRLAPVEILERLVEERRLIPLAVQAADGADRVRAITTFLALSRTVGRGGAHQPLSPAEELMELAQAWDTRRDKGEGQPDPQAVTLMTVHASKGLEFPIVVLAEADNGQGYKQNQVVISGEGALAVRFKNPRGETVKTADFAAIENTEKALEAEVGGRLFYVAATRARDHLVFLGWPNPKREAERQKERGKKKSEVNDAPSTVWLEALLDSPATALTGVVEYEAEELETPAVVSGLAAGAEEEAVSEPSGLMEPMRLVNFNLPVTALGRLLAEPEAYYRQDYLRLGQSAADNGDGESWFRPEPEEPEESPAGGGRLTPAEAGTLFHAVMETVDPAAPEIAAILRREATRLGLAPEPEEVKRIGAQVQSLLNGPIGAAWRAGRAAGFPDYREMPFTLRLPTPDGAGIITLNGVIDLFFQTSDGAGQIVDYKLASFKPGPRLTAYENQVRVYAQALLSGGFPGPIAAVLYFAGGRPFIHPTQLDFPRPITPILSGLAKNFKLLQNTRPLRPNRPGLLNMV